MYTCRDYHLSNIPWLFHQNLLVWWDSGGATTLTCTYLYRYMQFPIYLNPKSSKFPEYCTITNSWVPVEVQDRTTWSTLNPRPLHRDCNNAMCNMWRQHSQKIDDLCSMTINTYLIQNLLRSMFRSNVFTFLFMILMWQYNKIIKSVMWLYMSVIPDHKNSISRQALPRGYWIMSYLLMLRKKPTGNHMVQITYIS